MASYMVWKIENKYNLDLSNWVGPLGLSSPAILHERVCEMISKTRYGANQMNETRSCGHDRLELLLRPR